MGWDGFDWGQMTVVADRTSSRIVLHVGKQYRGTEKLVVEKALRTRPGVIAVDANPAAQTATATYDPQLTSLKQLRRFVEVCGFECAGCNVPGCICDPLQEPAVPQPRMTMRRSHARITPMDTVRAATRAIRWPAWPHRCATAFSCRSCSRSRS